MIPDRPLALLGYHPETARSLRDLGLLAVSVPTQPLAEVMPALRTLQYAGALVAADLEEDVLGHAQADAAARKAHRADALAFAGHTHATHTLEDAIVRLVQDSGYAVPGARLLICGSGPTLRAAAALGRLGAASLTLAAPSRPEAEQAAQSLPAGVPSYALAQGDPALSALAERADLIVYAEQPAARTAPLPPGLLQPFHTLLDLHGGALALAAREGVPVLDASQLGAVRLSLRLEHATGQRFKPEALHEVSLALHPR